MLITLLYHSYCTELAQCQYGTATVVILYLYQTGKVRKDKIKNGFLTKKESKNETKPTVMLIRKRSNREQKISV